MLKKLIPLVVVLLLVPVAGAQDDPWFIWLYEPTAPALIRVDQDGAVTTYPLEQRVRPDRRAFTPDGKQVALCWRAEQDSGPQGAPITLSIRDIINATTVLETEVGVARECTVSGYDGERVLLTLNVGPARQGGANDWQLLLLAAQDGAPLAELPVEGAVPNVQTLAPDHVIYAALPPDFTQESEFPAYRWDFGGDSTPIGTLAPNADHWGDQRVWTAFDETYPYYEGLPAPNVVKWQSGDGAPQIVYSAEDGLWWLIEALFIEDGARVAVRMQGPLDIQSTGPQPSRWVAIDPDGAVIDMGQTAPVSAMVAAPEGYVLVENERDRALATYVVGPSAVWQLEFPPQAQVIWSSN